MAKTKLIIGCEYRINGGDYGNRQFILLFHRKPDNKANVSTRNGKWKFWVDSADLVYIDTEANKKLGEKAKEEREKNKVTFIPSKGHVPCEVDVDAPQWLKISPQGGLFILQDKNEYPSFDTICEFDNYFLAYSWVKQANKEYRGLEFVLDLRAELSLTNRTAQFDKIRNEIKTFLNSK